MLVLACTRIRQEQRPVPPPPPAVRSALGYTHTGIVLSGSTEIHCNLPVRNT